jgi:hypothetical protein
VRQITDQYAECNLECDGMTNVLHFYLAQEEIEHTPMQGSIEDTRTQKDKMSPHRWIELETKEGKVIIDYRARMWLGQREEVPHGVFLPASYQHITYTGSSISLPELPEPVIKFLINQ